MTTPEERIAAALERIATTYEDDIAERIALAKYMTGFAEQLGRMVDIAAPKAPPEPPTTPPGTIPFRRPTRKRSR